MAEIVNLRRRRKAKERAGKEAQAEQNRIAFGRTKAEKSLTDAQTDLSRRRLDAHKRDDDET
jgi:hypothetical protein